MKIIRNDQQVRGFLFRDLSYGDVFEASTPVTDSVYMKIQPMPHARSLDEEKNAVRLQDGTLYHYKGDRVVVPLNVELYVQGRRPGV